MTADALLIVPTKSKTDSYKPALKDSVAAHSSAALTAATTFVYTALPAHALAGQKADFGSQAATSNDGIPDIVGLLFTVLVAGLGLFILKYVYDFAAEAIAQAPERADRLGLTGGGGGSPKSTEPVYDDTDFAYKDLSKSVENSRTRKKESKQMKADGSRFAPWMVIDEKRVEAAQKQRKLDKKRGR